MNQKNLNYEIETEIDYRVAAYYDRQPMNQKNLNYEIETRPSLGYSTYQGICIYESKESQL